MPQCAATRPIVAGGRDQPEPGSDDERAELRSVETAVDATGGDQLVVAAFLGDTRFVDHDDAVGMLDGVPGDAAAMRAPFSLPASHTRSYVGLVGGGRGRFLGRSAWRIVECSFSTSCRSSAP